MTKEELIGIAERCWATWNQWPPDQKAAYEAWWKMLSDLNADGVHQTIDGLAVSTDFCPKPGQLRRHVMGGDAPTPSAAWQSYLELDRAVNHGTPVPSVDETVAIAVRRVGAGLHTNGDRQFFFDTYAEVLANYRKERFAPNGTN
jgi:hypothetical protein